METIRDKNRGDPRCRRNAEAHGQLLNRARDGAGVTGLCIANIRVSQRVHAGKLQRAEEPERKSVHHDDPDRRADRDGGKHLQDAPRNQKINTAGYAAQAAIRA